MTYRLYTFVNHLYMNPKQWGIQTAHCVSTMSVAYKHNTEQHAAYLKWATEEPTIIMCEGGNVAMLTALHQRLEVLANALNLPIVKFHEDEQSLGGVITAVAVLVPDTLFNCQVTMENGTYFKREVPEGENPEDPKFYHFTNTEYEFLRIIKLAKLA